MKQLNLHDFGFKSNAPPKPNEPLPGDPPLPQLIPQPDIPPPPPLSPIPPLREHNYNGEPFNQWQEPIDPDDPDYIELVREINERANNKKRKRRAKRTENAENAPPRKPRKRQKVSAEVGVADFEDQQPDKRNKGVYEKRNKVPTQSPPPVQPIGREEEDPPYWEDEPTFSQLFGDDPGMKEILDAHWSDIRTHTIPQLPGRKTQKYNVRLDDPRLTVDSVLERIYNYIPHGFHVNIEYAFILVRKEDGALRYFHGAENSRAFLRDLLVHSRKGLRNAIERIHKNDYATVAFHDRPSTAWILRQVTNAIIRVYPMPRVVAGLCNKTRIPKYIRWNHGLKNFLHDPTDHPINDRLCFFRCLTYHKMVLNKQQRRFDPKNPANWTRFNLAVNNHFRQFQRYLRDQHIPGKLNGMPLHLLSHAEQCFGFPIHVYELEPYINEHRDRKKKKRDELDLDIEPDSDGEENEIRRQELRKQAVKENSFCAKVYRRPEFGDLNDEHDEARTMYLNVASTRRTKHVHFSYVHNRDLYSKCYICEKCNRPFHKSDNIKKHERRCKGNRVLNYYPGYGFATKPTIFERLEKKFGIRVPEDKKYHPYYATYDFECTFKHHTVDSLQPMDFGDHLPLPPPEDPDNPPAVIPIHVYANWQKVHSRTGPCREYTVVRSPQRSQVGDYIKAFAKLQRRRFCMSVKVLNYRNHMVSTQIAKSAWITTAEQVTDFIRDVDEKLQRFADVHQKKLQAVHLSVQRSQQDTTADLIPASVAMATNVPGFEDENGEPRAHFLLSQGSTRRLVRRFVDCLMKMARQSGKIMRRRFAPILRHLDKLWHERYLRQIYRILQEFIEEYIPLMEAQVAEKEAMEERDEATEEQLQNEKIALLKMMQAEEDIDDLLKPISGRTFAERQFKKYPPNDEPTLVDPKMSARCLGLPKEIKALFKLWSHTLEDKGRLATYHRSLKKIEEIKRLYKDIESYCMTLTTFGFNSAKFDIGLIRNWLLPELHFRSHHPLFRRRRQPRMNLDPSYVEFREKPKRATVSLIKRGHGYLSIQSSRLRFLDLTNFIAAGTSYDKWLASRNVNAGEKFFFPYEWFTSLRKLDEPLPPQDAFYSTLKGQGISDADYAKVVEKWATCGWRNMRDHLEYYNKQDVVPFLAGIESMRKFFMEQCRIDMIGGSAISLPGISEQRIYSTVPDHTFIVLPQKTKRVDNSDIATMVKEGIVGGPAITFRRYAEVGNSRIRDPIHGKLCRCILGFDANSLYLWATKQLMPCQLARRWDRQADGSFRGRPFYRYAKSEISWLEWESFMRGTKIYHRFNGGIDLFGALKSCKTYPRPKLKPEQSDLKDMKIEGVSVDGYDPVTRTCYFFDGCKWHYHIRRIQDREDKRCGWIDQARPCKFYNPNPLDLTERELARYTRRKDAAQREHLRREGYDVVVMSECDWWAYKKKLDPTAEEYLQKRQKHYAEYDAVECKTQSQMRLSYFLNKYINLPHPQPIRNEAEFMDLVKTDELFGIVEVDIEVPDNLRGDFAELTPIFKNVDINLKDIGPHMQRHVALHNLEKQFPRRALIGSYFAYRIPLITPLLKWYDAHGLKVTKIHKAFQFKPIAAFNDFGKLVEEARRKSDADPSWAPSGELEKYIGNAAYGKSLTELLKHLAITIMEHRKANEKARDPFFHSREELEYNLDEVSMSKERINNGLNTLFGFFVYNYAKMKMLSFYYDFLLRYIYPADLELILMDTDSFYMALSGPDLDSVVRDDMRVEYEANRSKFLPRRSGPGAEHDKRVPGLFKVEFEGTMIVAPNPKTYYAVGPKDKWSSKGIPKNQNRLTFDDYKRVLDTGMSHHGRVSSLIWDSRNGGKMIRRDGERVGISYLFAKRIVDDNGITTKPILL